MLEYNNLTVEKVGLSIVSWYMGGYKKELGSIPVAVRSDGTLMSETAPIARYIARHNGLYPTVPIEAYWNDYITNMYEPIINGNFAYLTAMGGK